MPVEPTIDPAAEFAYVTGQGRPHWAETIAGFARRSEATAARPGVRTDLSYGPHPRQRFDVVPAEGAARVSLIWLHPGYWQMRDRRAFRFLGETFAALGCDAVFADYPLAPEYGVAEITEAVRALVPAVRAEARARLGRALPIVAAGHSAGAHLAVELALTEPSHTGFSDDPVAAVLAVSGVYDLAPLVSIAPSGSTPPARAPSRRCGGRGAPASPPSSWSAAARPRRSATSRPPCTRPGPPPARRAASRWSAPRTTSRSSIASPIPPTPCVPCSPS